MKKILFLGGASFQCPIIEKAKAMGFYTLCTDYLPENPGHKIVDKSYVISTTDKEAVLKIARENSIDAVISYGTDVAIESQASVCEELGLIGPSLESAAILTQKQIFRNFLEQHGLQKSFFLQLNSPEKTEQHDELVKRLGEGKSYYVKPVDASGGKGISCIDSLEALGPAVDYAFQQSRSNTIVIEEAFDRSNPQLCGDGFILNSKIVFVGWGNGCFYPKVNAPYGEFFPSIFSKSVLDEVRLLLEKILVKSGYTTGPFNLDVLVGADQQIKILEIAPRCGGNFLPQAIEETYGVDMTVLTIKAALGMEITRQDYFPIKADCIYNLMLHSRSGGIIESLELPASFPKPFKFQSYQKPGTKVHPFTHGGNSFGNVMWRMDSVKALQEFDQLVKSVPVITTSHEQN